MSRRKVAAAGVLITAFALTLSACSSSSNKSGGSGGATTGASAASSTPLTGPPITIGVIDDTSGSASAYSPYAVAGVQLAVDQINGSGGIKGSKVSLVTESDGSVTTQTPTLVRKLISEGAQVIVLASGSASAIAARPVCADAKILCLAPTNLSTGIVASPGGDSMFILGPTAAGIGDLYAAAMTKLGVKKLAVVADDSATIASQVPSVTGPITAAGITVVDTEKVATTASDVSPQIARVKAANPDATIVLSSGGQTEILVQDALEQAMPSVQRFELASLINQPTTWSLADKGALKGLVSIGSIDTSNPRTKTFAAALTKAGGKYSALTAYQAQAADAINLIKQAITTAGGATDPTAITTAFQNITKFPATYGGPNFTLSFSATKHIGSDGNCGIVLTQWDANNQPTITWPTYQGSCP